MASRSRKARGGEAPEDDLDFAAEQIDAIERRRANSKVKAEEDAAAHLASDSSPQAEHVEGASASGSAPDMHADRRLMGAAATVGGATGMLLMGPATGVALGAAALYAATREDNTGALARKVGQAYLNVADKAIDGGLEAVDHGMKKIGQASEKAVARLSQEVESSAMPPQMRTKVNKVLDAASARCHSKEAVQGAPRGTAPTSEEARKIREKYPDRVPVLCERSPYSLGLPELPKKKYIVNGSMLCGEFKYMIHKQISQAGERPSTEQTIYIFVNGLAPKTSTPLSELYEKMRADDGFLYIKYGAENTLGRQPREAGNASNISRARS